MPYDIQSRLLRVLQFGEFTRVGGRELIKTDVRVVSATNKDLIDSIEKNRFREDLYYRLNVIPITLPPLRERKGDIPLLVEHFIEKICKREEMDMKKVSAEVFEYLERNQRRKDLECIQRTLLRNNARNPQEVKEYDKKRDYNLQSYLDSRTHFFSWGCL